jgi:hypothetical protein
LVDLQYFADEPPFFLRNSSSETTPPDIRLQRARETDLTTNNPFNPIPDSISDEYRSVIDDLTIENKRLKRRMRKYEHFQNEHLQSQALFEVRYHGLPPEKRRELEDLLRDFVTKAGHSPLPSTKSPSALDSSAMPSRLMAGPSSSSHPMSRVSGVGDSGYASMSALGQNSSMQSGKDATDQKLPMSSERKKDIQNYLSDIPPGLFPTRTGFKTEKERKRGVVRRLEQLFAGRDPLGANYQSKQQERVAQSAARHDRWLTEASGAEWKEEGTREARIMPKMLTPNHVKPDPSPSCDSHSKSDQDREITDASNNDQLVEQRPTRPLDLDPQRAQVPEENIEYMRHLGFSPPSEEDMEALHDGHGWIHLNVLTNMAQLHFLNVTPGFVQKAIKENSKMLELSPDGRKVRWKGGRGVTIPSNQSSPSYDIPMQEANPQNPGSKTGTRSSIYPREGSGQSRRMRHKLAYWPLFRTREDSEAEAGMDDEINYRLSTLQTSDMLGSPSQRNLGKQRATATDDSAPVIFYQNLGFYTDLSGDRILEAVGNRSSSYKRFATQAVGSATATSRLERLRRLQNEKGPLSRSEMGDDSSPEYSAPGSTTSSGLKGILPPMRKDQSSPSSTETADPMELEASGIGGVLPADNFSISVRSKQQREESSETPNYRRSKATYPMPIRNALLARRNPATADTVAVKVNAIAAGPGPSSSKKPSARSFVQREILTAKTKDLPASTLPEAVFLYRSSDEDTDENEDGDEMDDDDVDVTTSELEEMPKSALQHMDWAAIVPGSGTEAGSSSEGHDKDEDDNDDGNDLCTHPPRPRSNVKSKRSNAPSARAGASQPPPRSDVSTAADSEDDDEEEGSPNEDGRASVTNLARRMAVDISVGNSAASAVAGNNSGFTSPTCKTAVKDINVRHGTKRARKSEDCVPRRARKGPKVDRSLSGKP